MLTAVGKYRSKRYGVRVEKGEIQDGVDLRIE